MPFGILKRRRRIVIFGLILVAVVSLITIYTGLQSLNDRRLTRLHFEQDQQLRRRKQKQSGSNVIVGHYIGAGTLFGNASNGDMTRILATLQFFYSLVQVLLFFNINENHFNPVPGEGEHGNPVSVPTRDVLKMQHIFQVNRFNLMASDRVSLNRSLPDVRRAKCQARSYDEGTLPNTSVIIVFHNEAWSVLLRTIWSVINRSPRHLLQEILLVDDASDRTYLLKSLDEYVSKLKVPTKILRLPERSGLVAARLLGADAAKGDTLTFLDAHCECSIGWLEPLLARVRMDKRKVVCPVIDIISDDNFSYIKSFELHWGAFNWRLHFRWLALEQSELLKRQDDITVPFHTPTMAGGLFTIDKDYFFEIGSYDKEMKIWGGDNLEISFRIWQCGGEIEIVPCSHVGHLFRKSSPYTFPGGVNQVLSRNLARTAMVWMDEWADFFFKFNVDAQPMREMEDVGERVELRKELRCKSFKWYLDTIWPQHFFPTEKRFFGKILLTNSVSAKREFGKLLQRKGIFNRKGLIKSSNDHLNDYQMLIEEADHGNHWCLNRPHHAGMQSQPYGQAIMRRCENTSKNLLQQMFVFTEEGKLLTDENMCLDAAETLPEGKNQTMVRFSTCTKTARQLWTLDFKNLQLVQESTGFCLFSQQKNKEEWELFSAPCKRGMVEMAWIFLPFPWK